MFIIKKEELIKILKKGGNNDEFKSFEKIIINIIWNKVK